MQVDGRTGFGSSMADQDLGIVMGQTLGSEPFPGRSGQGHRFQAKSKVIYAQYKHPLSEEL